MAMPFMALLASRPVRGRLFQEAADAGESIVRAAHAFIAENGRPPRDAQELVPNYLHAPPHLPRGCESFEIWSDLGVTKIRAPAWEVRIYCDFLFPYGMTSTLIYAEPDKPNCKDAPGFDRWRLSS
jgi:hypothetical protein